MKIAKLAAPPVARSTRLPSLGSPSPSAKAATITSGSASSSTNDHRVRRRDSWRRSSARSDSGRPGRVAVEPAVEGEVVEELIANAPA